MNFKKVISVLSAAAVMSSMSVMCVSAVNQTHQLVGYYDELTDTTMSEADVTFHPSSLNGYSATSENPVYIQFSFSNVNDNTRFKLAYMDSYGIWHDLSDVINPHLDNTFGFNLDADDLANIRSGISFGLIGHDATVTNAEVSGEYTNSESSVCDKWVRDEATGKYSYATNNDSPTELTFNDISKLELNLSDYTSAAYSDIEKITIKTSNSTGSGMTMNATVKNPSDRENITGSYTSGNDAVINTPLGVKADSKLTIKITSAIKNAKVTIDSIVVNAKIKIESANDIYSQIAQKDDGTYVKRFVKMVPKADALAATKVNATLSNGTQYKVVPSSNYFEYVYGGTYKYLPQDDYVLVACSVANIPNESAANSLTCESMVLV